MSLLDLQRVTTRMLLEPAFEAQLRERGREALSGYELDELEATSLLGLEGDRFAFSAWAVRTKRGQLFWMCLPSRLRQAVSEALGTTLTTRFAELFPHVGMHPWIPNLSRMLHWLSGPDAVALHAPPVFRAWACYEKLRILLPRRRSAAPMAPAVESHLRIGAHVALVQFPVDLIEVAKRPPSEWGTVPATPTELCVVNERHGLLLFPVPSLLRALGVYADGTRDVAELIAALRTALNDERDELVSDLSSYMQRGLLEVTDLSPGQPGA